MIREIESGYGVDAAGVVYCNRPINGKGNATGPWRVVKPLPAAQGRYLQVGIDGRKHSVHRLVARAFLGEPAKGQEVSHLNGNSHDNRACNLAYAVHQENERLKRSHGTDPAGVRNASAVLSDAAAHDIRQRVAAGSRGIQRALAREYGVSEATVSMIVRGKRWIG